MHALLAGHGLPPSFSRAAQALCAGVSPDPPELEAAAENIPPGRNLLLC